MAHEQNVSASRDPEVQRLRVRSLQLIAEAESIYHELSDHQAEMAGFLRRAQDVVEPKDQRE